ncbi:hypothetical protein, partial [Burkholderia ambifaria]
LEQQSAGQPTPQLDLFAAPPPVYDDEPDFDLPEAREPAAPAAPHPALVRLREIDPDNLKPREALDLLYELQTLAARQADDDLAH